MPVKASSELDELFVLLLLREIKLTSRYQLARTMGISEGEARGFLRKLEDRGIVLTEPRKGTTLTARGETRIARLLTRFGIKAVSKLPGGALGVGHANCAVHVRDRASFVKLGIEQRDEAIKAGASGAITLTYDGHDLSYPYVKERLNKWNPQASRFLTGALRLKAGDTVVITFSEEYGTALRGAIAAVLTLMPSAG